MTALDTRIARLTADGRHREAAALLETEGEPLRAAQLYAQLWLYAEAIAVCERAGRLDEAYRYALLSPERTEVDRVLRALREDPTRAPAAADIATARGRHGDAARLHASTGDLGAAAEAFAKAGETFEAARCKELLGELREAGRLYEQRTRDAPGDTEAHLRLGRILAGFGRHEAAVRALQRAAEDPARRPEALRRLIPSLHALGLEDAARLRLVELRALDPDAPERVTDLVPSASSEGAQWVAGRYRVLRPLGSGGTGRVLLAHDVFQARDVAVKVLAMQGGDASREAFVRFAREARLAQSIDHPNVVHVYEFQPDGPLLVMEWMQGGTLAERFEPGRPLAPELLRHVLRSVLAGLSALHRRGVVHRDLKPENVLFGATGDVKIGDFGVAHLSDFGTTRTGAMLGTLATMAPEQIHGAARPTAQTDLYAVGVLLYRALVGQLPFPGPDFVTQHLEWPPPVPSAAAAYAGEAFDALVAALLAKDPAARPFSADAVAEQLEALDWTAMARRFEELPTAAIRRASTQPPRAATRLRPEGGDLETAALFPGAVLAFDTLLERRVLIVSTRDAALWRARGRVLSPYVQAVLDVDEEEGQVVLEWPTGTRPPSEPWEGSVQRDVDQARAALTAAGLEHGAVDADHVRVGDARTVLLWEHEPQGEATAAG